jgi:hypothetical protein
VKTIDGWNDLRAFGIEVLTGEACGLSYRILCDVTARGKAILERALGVKELRLPESWNRGPEGDPHVGSILLAPDLLPMLAIFALLESGCPEVWRTSEGAVFGFEPGDDPGRREAVLRVWSDRLVRRYAYAGTAGDRNVHVMSERIE